MYDNDKVGDPSGKGRRRTLHTQSFKKGTLEGQVSWGRWREGTGNYGEVVMGSTNGDLEINV